MRNLVKSRKIRSKHIMKGKININKYYRKPSKDKFQTPPDKSITIIKKSLKVNETLSDDAGIEEGIIL